MRRIALVFALAVAASGGDDSHPAGAPADGGAGADAMTGADAGASDAAPSDSAVSDTGPKNDGATASGRWMMGYYAGYEAATYPVPAIDWAGVTHLAVAFYLPKNDATLDETLFLGATNGPALAHSLVLAAHQNGRKAIASIGGAGMHAQWVSAASSANRATFVANLKALVAKYEFDGLDLDWEPLDPADMPTVQALAAALRAALPNATLTMPAGYINVNNPDDLSGVPAIVQSLDQINLMTYGMSGAYSGWKSWHSSAMYQTDSATPVSVDSSVKAYLKAGVPAAKLGVGVGFYGECYTPPVSGPDQALNGSTIAGNDGSMSYANIMTTYFSASARKWDANAHVPFLTFATATGPHGCGFVTYEDEQSIADKGAYVKANGLGGAIVWTINQGYLPNAAQKNPLLEALKTSIIQ